MKRILPFLLLLPFFFSSCLDEVFDMSFQYRFQSSFALPAAEGVHEFVVLSDEFELGLIDEMEARRLTKVTAAFIESMRLVIPEDYKQNWDFANIVTVYMLIDGEPHLLAEVEGMGGSKIGNVLDLTPAAEEFRLMDFLDHEIAQLKLVILSQESLPEPIEVSAEAFLMLKAQPMK